MDLPKFVYTSPGGFYNSSTVLLWRKKKRKLV
ncbi:hypothetical protein Vi05172_g13368 [Venturia inaequalis]|nr:hypothetical protein Vi05172_g13368 [Venturia inaequalis]